MVGPSSSSSLGYVPSTSMSTGETVGGSVGNILVDSKSSGPYRDYEEVSQVVSMSIPC